MKTRKCKLCADQHPDESSIKTPAGRFCTVSHAMAYANTRQDYAAKKLATYRRAAVKAEKERLRTKSEWANNLQVVVNRYIRLRDHHDGCISCDLPASWDGQWHASHYYARGHNLQRSALRFNLWNIHKSCSICNNHHSSNRDGYTPAIIEKIGQERYDWMVAHKSDVVRRDAEWYRRAIRIARMGVKRMENRYN